MPIYGDFGIWFDDSTDVTAPGWEYMFGSRIIPDVDKPLAQRVVSQFDATRKDASPGRRLRVFAQLVDSFTRGTKVHLRHRQFADPVPIHEGPEGATYEQVYGVLQHHEAFRDLALRWGVNKDRPLIHEWRENRPVLTADPELHPALQDLGAEILSDTRDACAVFNDPDLYFPGIDDGIEPVSDDHVKLVIWALQRELNRETRGHPETGARLPAAPLTDLPWRIQRALAERRRYRFTVEYGITKEKWRAGTWDLMSVREDSDFIPRRWLRQ